MPNFLSVQIDGRPTISVELHQFSKLEILAVDLPEDATFRIGVACASEWGRPVVELGDIPVELLQDNGSEEIAYFSGSVQHLLNHFGRCGLNIVFPDIDLWLCPVHFNVLAKKLNASQAESILLHLSENGDDILRFCFSKTEYGADPKKSEHKDPSLILQHAESIIDYLAKNRSYFRSQCKSKLVTKDKVSTREESNGIDDTTISWLFQNLEQLTASDRINFDVAIKGWKYQLSNIQNTHLVEDTDVFENRVILSLIYSVKERLSNYLKEAPVINLSQDSALPGYVSLSEILGKIFPVTGFWRKKCQDLVARTNTLIMFFQKVMPCARIHDLRPSVTPFVRGNNTYRQTFNLADVWYGLGVPDWTGQQYVVSLFSLPKLYEFFCLNALIKSFAKLDFVFLNKEYRLFDDYSSKDGKEMARPASEPFNYYSFVKGDLSVELFYEPKIWSFRDFSENRRLVDLTHGRQGKRPYRSPDFLVRLSSAQNRQKYLILDSKYSTAYSVGKHHIPALINKYLLGLGETDTRRQVISQAPILGVLALHPNVFGDIAHLGRVTVPNHLNGRFSPIGHLVIPALAGIEMGPLQENNFAAVFERIVSYFQNSPE